MTNNEYKDTAKPSFTTLENLTSELLKQQVPIEKVEERLQVAGMLALAQASYAVVHESTMPTPMHRISYDPTNYSVQCTALKGRAAFPNPNALDMSLLDTLVASLLKEKMPVLLEGITGVGKTHTVEKFMRTILPKENYRSLRLNASMSNVLQPYTQGTIEGGMLKVSLRNEELDRVAAIFIDEVNRGDSNKVLQLQDGVIRLASGEGGELGIPVPRLLANGEWELDYVNKRPPFVVSAQNPPRTKNAKYTGTRGTDAAQSNRNLQLDVPNNASTTGSSLLLMKSENGMHEKFMAAYKNALASNLNVALETLAELDNEWMSVYAFATDPKKTSCPIVHSALEFSDGLMTMLGPDLHGEFEHDKAISKEISKALRSYRVDFEYDGVLTKDAKSLEKLRRIVNSFSEEIVPRDIIKGKKFSDAISLIRRIKTAATSDDPVKKYQELANYVTVQDVASGFSIMLQDKQDKQDDDPTVLVDTVLREYIKITESYSEKMGLQSKFSPEKINLSVYKVAVGHAVSSSLRSQNVESSGASNPNVYSFIQDLGSSVAQIKRLEAGNEYRKPLIARIVADMTTLAAFADQYKDELETVFAASSSPKDRRLGLKNLYQEKRGLIGTPDIYVQRLTRVLGV
jgi:hypothetical protein